MKRSKTHVLCVCLLLIVAGSAYGQRAEVGVDVGQASDKFGALPSTTTIEYGVDGQVTIIKANEKKGGPSIVAGGEILVPSDSLGHVKEYAVHGGPMFQTHNFTIGVNVQIRKVFLPQAVIDNQIFNRQNMELLELPATVKYVFGPDKHLFVQAQGTPEFSPRFRTSAPNPFTLPNPSLDHAYSLRGSVGYIYRNFYIKATYQTRYFKFTPAAGNPNGIYNWRSDMILGGVGLAF